MKGQPHTLRGSILCLTEGVCSLRLCLSCEEVCGGTLTGTMQSKGKQTRTMGTGDDEGGENLGE